MLASAKGTLRTAWWRIRPATIHLKEDALEIIPVRGTPLLIWRAWIEKLEWTAVQGNLTIHLIDNGGTLHLGFGPLESRKPADELVKLYFELAPTEPTPDQVVLGACSLLESRYQAFAFDRYQKIQSELINSNPARDQIDFARRKTQIAALGIFVTNIAYLFIGSTITEIAIFNGITYFFFGIFVSWAVWQGRTGFLHGFITFMLLIQTLALRNESETIWMPTVYLFSVLGVLLLIFGPNRQPIIHIGLGLTALSGLMALAIFFGIQLG